MIICFIAPANSYHTIKWCKYFLSKGYIVHVISFANNTIEGVHVHYIDTGANQNSSDFVKLKYLFKFISVKSIIDTIRPDIISVHFASSYGVVAALSSIKNYTLSVWGSDVYDFPKRSIFHKLLIKFALYRASQIFSTSQAMAIETHKYTNKPIEITPFGVDCNLFNPDKRTRKIDDKKFIVGTVKTLSPKYGISTLLKAVSIVRRKFSDMNLELRIAGKGSHEAVYKKLADNLGISDITKWLGFISQEDAAREWANMDCAIIPSESESESESFGVSAVEAQACGIPVIISDIPGLMEATKPEETSLVIKRGDAQELAEKIIILLKDEEKRKELGSRGRAFVVKTYELDFCFNKIENLLITNNKNK